MRGGSAHLYISGMVRIFERDLAAIKTYTAGRLTNDLMSNFVERKLRKNEKRGLQGNLL